jgi:N utilization substance protein B
VNPGTKPQATGPDKAKAPPKSARRRARELALQGLYEWLLSKDSGNQNAGAIDAHVRETAGFDRADAAHFDILLHGVMKDPERLRTIISPHLDRPMAELSPIEHAVLLIGTFELVNQVEIPYRVIINEAVELAKSFGGTDGFRYVNGVLDKVAIDIRPAEVSAPRRR